MDIKGFHVVSEVTPTTDTNPDGFITTVTAQDGTVRGPFNTIREAVQCAHAWDKETRDAAKAALQKVADAAPVTAAVENGGVGETKAEEAPAAESAAMDETK